MPKKKYGAMLKKRETYEALKIAKKRRKRMEHMKILKYWGKRERDSPYF